jgi:hypothetical protein
MFTTRLSVLTGLGAMLLACGPGASDATALYLSSDVRTFDGRSQHAVLRVQAFQADGSPGQGAVSLLTPAGQFVGGSELALVDGLATASFQCDPAVDPNCSGTLRLTASWAAQSAAITLTVTPSTEVSAVHWRVVSTGTLEALKAVAVADAQTLYAVGTGGAVQRLTGSVWEPLVSGVTETLLAATVSPQGTLLTVGAHGTFLALRAGALEAIPGEPLEDYSAVAALSDTEVLIGTASGLLKRWDGVELADEADLGTPVLSLVVQGNEVWAGGVGVMAVRRNGVWEYPPCPVPARLTIAVGTPSGLYLGGSRMDTSGGVLLQGPASWSTQTLDLPLTALAVPPSSTERFVVTDTSVLRAVGAGAFRSVDAPMGGQAAASRSSGDLVVVGAPGVSLLRVP